MASKERDVRAGTTAGIEGVICDAFGEEPRPTLVRSEVVKRIREALLRRSISGAELRLSEMTVRPGALFDMLGAPVRFPPGHNYQRSFVALVDLEPNARWGHPALWAFVPANGEGEVAFVDTELPPHDQGPVRFSLASEDAA